MNPTPDPLEDSWDLPQVAEAGFDGDEAGDVLAAVANPAFGTFFIGEAELALPTDWVREVVPYPERVTPVPLAGEGVHGVFSLRGEVLPILDLAVLLRMDSSAADDERRVVIVDGGGSYLGVALDRTGEVLRPEPEEVHRMEHRSEDGRGVIDGVIRLESEARFIQTLSAEALGIVPGVPRTDGSQLGEQGVDTRCFSKAIAVRVGGMELALRIEDVREIQSDLLVSPSPAYFEQCAGVVMVRGVTYPVLDLRRALGLSEENEDEGRFVFVQNDGTMIALVVDSLTETVEFPDDSLIGLPPALGSDLTSVCSHLLEPQEGRHVLMMDLSRLYERFRVHGMPGVLNNELEADADEVRADDPELGFFAFRVASKVFCVPLEQVREVREVDAGAFSGGPSTDEVRGLMNLRGQVLPLIGAQEKLGLEVDPGKQAEGRGEVALILGRGDQPFGLVVDSVVDIKRVRTSQVSPYDEVLSGKLKRAGLLRFVESALLIQPEGGDSEVIVVLSTETLFDAPGKLELPQPQPEPQPPSQPASLDLPVDPAPAEEEGMEDWDFEAE